ncbi:short-chain dehydrogenase [Trinickia dabaoshanensis]|uniref:Short-chain dehydrogenase n=1 Tax=Trinickia dabaoshanensis TaxID=564714 RepID=A0A2N7VCY6_9BURK|nr:SDR family NAD(P)-dependent oxidoreductase [Trinickia dabaoshanensis]PMS14954.1 short-chain dehydrogenase [Trinickia dabaoshanensis]
MKTFNDKVAAITGASSGIGRALALALARQGCHLALSDVDARALAETAALAEAAACSADAASPAGVRVTTSVVDVAERAAMLEWARATHEQHGRVNLIFNNAGVALSSTVEGMAYEDLEWIVSINFWGVVHGTKAFLPYLKASGDGHIVNTSSVFGLFSQPGMSAYNATKFAVRGFTESLREELDMLRCGVSATCVHPGGIRTNIARTSRISSNMCGFLIEDDRQGRRDFERLFITSAEQAARAILDGVRHNRRRVLIGRDAHAADWLARILPSAYQALVVRSALRMSRAARKRASRAHAATMENELP